jgi:hypothetical protein
LQQVERDGKVAGLVRVMKTVFETATEAESELVARCKDSKQALVVSRMLQQASECGNFILSYAKPENANFCEYSTSCLADALTAALGNRLVKNTISTVDKAIERYNTVLEGLINDFRIRTNHVTNVYVLRIANDLEDVAMKLSELGMRHFVGIFVHAHVSLA